jgi:Ni,Fe-hydrogenase III large subunit
MAYAQMVESLCGTRVPARALAWRGVALELERPANHVGDLGALANDVGYLPTASFCGRIRGDFLNMTALLCGSRFGRGLIRPGGVGFDAEPDRVKELLRRLEQAGQDTAGAVELLWKSNSVMARFENTGAVSREDCMALGLVGPAARACGIERDVRHDFPHGIYNYSQIPVSTAQTGDVLGRAFVRWLDFVRETLEHLPEGRLRTDLGACVPQSVCVSLVEGWRGEICHVALTDGGGRWSRYKVVDPSFHNWFGLALAMRNQQISDFPLCNKSFNLSYCGHDL